jgi:hypothetical protein
MTIYTPYVYLIGWSTHDQYYIGSRIKNSGGIIAHPSELFEEGGYTTSSVRVDNFVAKHGNPDIVRVLKTFMDGDSAYAYETKILQRLDARTHPKMLNGHNNDGWCSIGPKSEETKTKMSLAKIGKKRPPRSKKWSNKISKALTGRKMQPHTEEWKQNMSALLTGRKCPPRSKEWSEKLSKANAGKRWITNGVEAIYVPGDYSLPDGWRYGRK